MWSKEGYLQLLIRWAEEHCFPPNGRYRGRDGRLTPVGLLIPNKEYIVSIEKISIVRIFVWRQDLLPPGVTAIDLEEIHRYYQQAWENGYWDSQFFIDNVKQVSCFTDLVWEMGLV